MQPKEMPFSIDRDADTPLVEQFVAGVRAAVASGRYRRGDKLPTIEEWSGLLGVSFWVPRKGLARLVEERLIVVKKHVGAVVLSGAPQAPKGRAQLPFPPAQKRWQAIPRAYSRPRPSARTETETAET